VVTEILAMKKDNPVIDPKDEINEIDEVEIERSREKAWREEAMEESLETDRVAQEIRYSSFLSRSKGRVRKRKNPQEVKLVSYGRRTRVWERFPFDEVITEVMPHSDGYSDTLKDRIIEIDQMRRRNKCR